MLYLYSFNLSFVRLESTSSRGQHGERIRGNDVENPLPILETKIPESYIEVHESIKKLASDCRVKGTPPVYTRKELL